MQYQIDPPSAYDDDIDPDLGDEPHDIDDPDFVDEDNE